MEPAIKYSNKTSKKTQRLNGNQVAKGLFQLGCMGIGAVWRYQSSRSHKQITALFVGALAGHKVGAAVGSIMLGPAGQLVGIAASAAYQQIKKQRSEDQT